MKPGTAALLGLLAATLLVAPPSRADHDDGDDVRPYRWVLRFDAKELSPFAGYVVVDGSDMDSRLEVTRRVGGDAPGGSATDVAFDFVDAAPVTIYAIPGRDLLARVEAWLRAEASRSPDRVLWRDAESLRRFEAAFGREVRALSYVRSPLMSKMLGITRCRVHFLKGPRDRLETVREAVSIPPDPGTKSAIATTGYVLEYRGAPPVELSPERASRLTKAECRQLLSPPGKGAASSSLAPPGAPWTLGAPAFAALALAGVAIRRRRGGT